MTRPVGLDVDRMLRDPNTRVIVTCGSGGVGKTTTAAAMALRAAEFGRNTVVLTIDPAKRLAQSMGLTELDNSPREVKGIDYANGGSLSAMMLDMKRTFDEVILQSTTKERAEELFNNPFYMSLSSSFGGTQEYMAMEKLAQLASQNKWDLIVVDTPPSRSALDFLDAPNRLGKFLDGRMIRIITLPARSGGRAGLKVMSAGFTLAMRAVAKILGAQLLHDVSAFASALEAALGGFRERADRTYQMLKAPGTRFVVVAAPEPDALREASYFVNRLGEDVMPLAGLILNRVHQVAPGAEKLSSRRSEAAAEALRATGDHQLAEAALRVHTEVAAAAENDARMARQFSAAHPGVAIASVPALASDVHDLDGLREVGRCLAGSH